MNKYYFFNTNTRTSSKVMSQNFRFRKVLIVKWRPFPFLAKFEKIEKSSCLRLKEANKNVFQNITLTELALTRKSLI